MICCLELLNFIDARILYLKAVERMEKGGFNLRKWRSSNLYLVEEFSEHDSKLQKLKSVKKLMLKKR